ncbi:alpha/beta hydrolase [Amycolatopsis panacis]|uniref:DUF1023 domain-containing protein n=1 Tax=Amycolatopsis panacis TaxID=2340917 RepID=A0A419I8C4_9PSEU|nr:alpha/beta hydrolase [Amycolatopsis panacis]RJQ88407.1 hypothetical protein D5S19_06540 [Amycolatopsis panacis]
MVSISDVKRWNPATLNEAATTAQQREQTLIHSGDDYGKTMPIEGWTGGAADDALSAHRLLMFRLEKLAANANVVHKALMQASDAIPPVQNAIHAAEELARKYGYSVDDAGGIIDAFAGREPSPEMHPEDRARARQQVADDLAQALRTAEDIDVDLATVLRRAGQGEFGSGNDATVAAAAAAAEIANPGLTLPEPPPNATAAQNAAWWATLSPAGQGILLRDHPDWLGNRDGLPGAVRSQANTARLPGERARLAQEQAGAQRMVDAAKAVYDPSGGVMGAALTRLQEVNGKIAALDAVQTTMGKGNRQLLFLDTTHPRVEAAIAVGNIDTARNVAVFTPGFTTTVNGDLAQYDRNMDDLRNNAHDIERRHGGGPTAAVTWIGYQAPQWDGIGDPGQSVLAPPAAQAGGDSLAKFYNGIGAGHDASGTPLHLTALGHSYGSTTTGYALGHDTPVQDAMLFGSPGQGAEHLKIPEGRLYSEHNAGDTLVPSYGNTGALGPSPYFSPDASHYHQMSTDASVTEAGQLNATKDHSGYLDAGSTSIHNMAAITTGHPDLAQYKGTVLADGPR